MNKQEIENKLKQIIRYSTERDIAAKQFIDRDSFIAKESFNLALELAAENAYVSNNHQHGTAWDSEDFEIDKQSILDLKL